MLDLDQAIRERHSTRLFLSQPEEFDVLILGSGMDDGGDRGDGLHQTDK